MNKHLINYFAYKIVLLIYYIRLITAVYYIRQINRILFSYLLIFSSNFIACHL